MARVARHRHAVAVIVPAHAMAVAPLRTFAAVVAVAIVMMAVGHRGRGRQRKGGATQSKNEFIHRRISFYRRSKRAPPASGCRFFPQVTVISSWASGCPSQATSLIGRRALHAATLKNAAVTTERFEPAPWLGRRSPSLAPE